MGWLKSILPHRDRMSVWWHAFHLVANTWPIEWVGWCATPPCALHWLSGSILHLVVHQRSRAFVMTRPTQILLFKEHRHYRLPDQDRNVFVNELIVVLSWHEMPRPILNLDTTSRTSLETHDIVLISRFLPIHIGSCLKC